MADRYAEFKLDAEDVLYLQGAMRNCVHQGTALAGVFYDELFRQYPKARELFSNDTSHQQKMFSAMLQSAAAELQVPDALEPLLARLGTLHRNKGVSASQLEMGREPFLAAIRSCIGEDDFIAHRPAWNGLYSLMTSVMRSGALRK